MDYPCGQRLEPAPSETIDVLVSFNELSMPDSTVIKLKRIKSDTINKQLKPYKVKLKMLIVLI